MSETIHQSELQIDGPLARLSLNHAPLNILTTELRRQMLDQIGLIERDRTIRVVVFQSACPRAFSVGSDLKEFPHDETGGRQKIQFEQFLLQRIEGLDAITIACLSGYVLGGGAELMLATDLRIAAEDVQFGFPEVKLGGFPAAGGVWRLVRDIGLVRAKELLFFGKTIPALTARDLGLINECVPKQQLKQRLDQLIDDLLKLPQSSLLAIKRTAALASAGSGGRAGIDSQVTDEYGKLFLQQDMFEGILAFLEKRQPQFNRAPAVEKSPQQGRVPK